VRLLDRGTLAEALMEESDMSVIEEEALTIDALGVRYLINRTASVERLSDMFPQVGCLGTNECMYTCMLPILLQAPSAAQVVLSSLSL